MECHIDQLMLMVKGTELRGEASGDGRRSWSLGSEGLVTSVRRGPRT